VAGTPGRKKEKRRGGNQEAGKRRPHPNRIRGDGGRGCTTPGKGKPTIRGAFGTVAKTAEEGGNRRRGRKRV